MNGYHSIIGDHSLVCFDKKTRLKYIKKNKVPILNAFSDVVNDFYMQNKVSYKFYAKQWNWDFKYVKEFLHHLGFKITTSQGINKHSILELITPIKSSKYPEEIFGLAQKYFSPEVSPESLQKVHQKKEIISNTSEYFSPEVSPDFHQKSQLNKIKEYNKRNKKNIKEKKKKIKKEKEKKIPEGFKEIYLKFEKINSILRKYTDRAVSRSKIEYCWKMYEKKLKKNYSLVDIEKAIFNFIADKLINTKHAIPMLSSIINGFAEGRYDIDYYLSIENGRLREKAKKYLEWLVGNKKENSKEDLQNMQKFINSGLMPLD